LKDLIAKQFNYGRFAIIKKLPMHFFIRYNKLEFTQTMPTLEELKNEIDEIKKRNTRVEIDKAWETSLTRKLLILVLTYFVVVIFFIVTKLANPFVNSLVPTLGFFISTLTVPWIKAIWMKKNKK